MPLQHIYINSRKWCSVRLFKWIATSQCLNQMMNGRASKLKLALRLCAKYFKSV